MDDRLRDLERAGATGGTDAILAYGRELCRAGRHAEARATLFPILLESPNRKEVRDHYIRARGFLPERTEDEHLGDAFIYHNLPVGNEVHTIVQGNTFLERGDRRTFDKWKPYFQKNKKGIRGTNAQIEAAIKLGWYSLRDHAAFAEDLAHYTSNHRRNETSGPLFGKLTYKEESKATLEECLIDGKIGTRELTIPTLNQNYATLAREQPENQLGTTEQAHNQFFTELFGTNPEQLVAAFQYFTARRNGNLREVRLWTPDQQNRRQYPERALVLGNYGYGDRFGIGCGDVIGGPGLGWRSYVKNPS